MALTVPIPCNKQNLFFLCFSCSLPCCPTLLRYWAPSTPPCKITMALPFNGLRCARASEQARATMLAALGPSHNNTAHLSTITLPTSSSLSSSSSSSFSSAAASSSSALQSVVEESSSAAYLASLDRPDARTPAQRNRRPPNRFSPNDYARNTQSEYASPHGIGQHKRRRKLVLGGVAHPSSSNATIIQTISTPVPPARPLPTRAEAVSSAAAATSNPQPSFRCPMVNCTRHCPGAAGWTSLRSLIQHVNTCHLVNDEVLPASFLREHNVSVCTPCKTLQTAQVPGMQRQAQESAAAHGYRRRRTAPTPGPNNCDARPDGHGLGCSAYALCHHQTPSEIFSLGVCV